MPILTKNIQESIKKLTFLHKKYELTAPLFIDFDDAKLSSDSAVEVCASTDSDGNFPKYQAHKLRAGFSTKKYCSVYCGFGIYTVRYKVFGKFCTTLDLAIKSFEKEISSILSAKLLDGI